MSYLDATNLKTIGSHNCIDNLVDMAGVRAMTGGMSREAIHARVKAGTIPAPIGTLNGGRVWAKHDLDEWLGTMPAVKLKIGRKYRRTRLVRFLS